MAYLFTLSIGGAAQQLAEDLGWSVESLVRRNLATDTVLLRKSHIGARTLVRGDSVVVYADGLRIFTGTVSFPQVGMQDSGSVLTVQLQGPWQVLVDTPFTRSVPRREGSGATATASVSGGAVTGFTITNAGSGYLDAVVVLTPTSGGLGCRTRVNVSDAGTITSITVLAGGTFYGAAPTVSIIGLTQIPPKLGSTWVSATGDGQLVYDPSSGSWTTPSAGTTYKWARADNFAASPKELDMARYVSARGLVCDANWADPSFYRTLAEEVRACLRYVQLTRARLAAVDRPDLTPAFTADLAAIQTALGSVATPRYRTFCDQKVAQLLQTLLACKPDVSSWFDYSPEVPELHMRVASLETEEELTHGQVPLGSLSATPRPELVPTGVVIRWQDPSPLSWEYRGYQLPMHTDKSPSTVQPWEPGVLTHTLDYQDDVSVFKPALAASFMASLGVLRATGSMALAGLTLEQAMAVRPGRCYRLPWDAELADSQLLVQETTWSPRTGQVQCTLGYPAALDLQTLAHLQGWITVTMNGFLASRTVLAPPPPPE